MIPFKKNGFICLVQRDPCEPYEQFIERGYFVVSQKPLTLENYNEAVKYSRVYINIKYNKCQYNKKMMEIVKNFEEKLYVV